MASFARHAARRRLAAAVVALGLAITAVFVLAYFQPQDLFINHTVDQARPAAFTAASTPPPASLSCSARPAA